MSRPPHRRRPAAVTLLPGLLLLSMASAGGFSTGVASSSERVVEIVVSGSHTPAVYPTQAMHVGPAGPLVSR